MKIVWLERFEMLFEGFVQVGQHVEKGSDPGPRASSHCVGALTF
jgi:hypothetical protein